MIDPKQPALTQVARMRTRSFAATNLSGLAIALSLVFGGHLPSAHAQSTMLELNLPAQSLSDALLQLGRQTSLQFIYPSDLVRGLRAPAVLGRFAPEEALQRLLNGTGLAYAREGNSITLVRTTTTTQLDAVTVVGAARSGLDSYVATTESSTKLNTPLIETPRSISVVTQEQIKTQSPKSIEQALAYTSGVLTETSGGGDNRMSGAIIRGFSDGSAYYKDGLKQLAAGSYGSWNDPIDELESIEVVKGPASVYYGQGRPGGVINVVSKRPSVDHVNSVGVSYGRYDRAEVTADLGGSLSENNDVLYRVNVLGREAHARTVGSQDDRFSIAPSVLWNISGKTKLTLLGQFSRERGTPKTWWPSHFVYPQVLDLPASRTAGDPGFDYFNRNTKSIGYQFEHETASGWRLQQNVRYSEIDIDYAHIYAYQVAADSRSVLRGSLAQVTNGKTVALDNRAERDFQWGDLHHTLSLGVDVLKYKERTDLGFGDAPNLDMYDPVYGQHIDRPQTDRSNTDLNQIGVYTMNQLKLGQWVGNLSLRHDMARIKQTSTTQPRVKDESTTGSAGLLYLFDNGLAPYVSYATSFDPIPGRQFDGTPFKPREGEQYELGLKYQPPGAKAFITAAVFEINQTNVTTADPDHPRFSVQTGEVRSRGFELEGKAELTRELGLLANYTYVDPKTVKSNNPLEIGRQSVQTVKNSAAMWLDYRPVELPGLMLAGGVRYRGKAFFGKSATGGDYYDKPFTLVDAAVAYETRQYRVALNVNNLFNKKYFTSTFRGASREAMLSLNYYW